MDADRGLNKTGRVVRRLLRHLRARAAPDAKGTVKTWRIEELAHKINKSKEAVRHALIQLKQKANADIHIYGNSVTLRGPKRIEYRKVFALPPPPATPLACHFRTHGVLLESQLLPQTSWSQMTLKSLTDGVSQVVLTLDESLMVGRGTDRKFTCIHLARKKWNRSAANRRRATKIRDANKNNNGLVRVIVVRGKPIKQDIFRIVESKLDNYFWRITDFDFKTGVFAAKRTLLRVKSYPLQDTAW